MGVKLSGIYWGFIKFCFDAIVFFEQDRLLFEKGLTKVSMFKKGFLCRGVGVAFLKGLTGFLC